MKAECQRTDAFKLRCLRRLLRVPWTARRSNQSILKEIIPEYSLKGLMLKLKLQYFGHLMLRADSLEKTLMLGKIEGKRRRRWQGIRWLDGITDSMDMNLGKLREIVKDRWDWPGVLQSMGSGRVARNLATEQQQRWMKKLGPSMEQACFSLNDRKWQEWDSSRIPCYWSCIVFFLIGNDTFLFLRVFFNFYVGERSVLRSPQRNPWLREAPGKPAPDWESLACTCSSFPLPVPASIFFTPASPALT